jgi:aspartate/methionine/tyrosine aminotransferase
VVTVGASGAFVLSFLAAFDPGDRLVVPEPAFPAYKNTLRPADPLHPACPPPLPVRASRAQIPTIAWT